MFAIGEEDVRNWARGCFLRFFLQARKDHEEWGRMIALFVVRFSIVITLVPTLNQM